MRASANYGGTITKFRAIDLGEGWSLVTYTEAEDDARHAELTNGTRLVHAHVPNWAGVWADYPIAFAQPQRAMDAALACLD